MELFILAPLVLVFIAIIAFAIKKASKGSTSQSSGYSSSSSRSRSSSSSGDAGLLILLGSILLVAASPMIAASEAGSGEKGSGLAWLILIAIIGGGLYILLTH